MFCSFHCQQSALKSFHQYECPMMSSLLRSGSVNIALRLFFISLSAFNGSFENLEKFTLENEKSNSTIFDFDFTDENCEVTVKNYLKCLSSLSRSHKTFSLDSHIEILLNHPELKETFKTHETFVKSFLQRQCKTNDLYFHGVLGAGLKSSTSKDSLVISKGLQQSIGSGWFPFCSLINHSCAPNICRIYVEGKVVLVAIRPIGKGSQLFDCYK